jgi:hypothetical protein
MKGENRTLLFLVCAGMELCYLYACTNFGTMLFLHQTFPFPEAIGSFLIAALLTLFAQGRGWRVIYVLGFQLLGFIPALLRMVDVFKSWSSSFLSQTWLTDFFTDPSSPVQYSIFVLVIIWILVFWAGGVGLANRSKDYATICSRFDRGLVAFFVLFLTKFYLQAAQGLVVDESTSGVMLFPFLIFSLLAIGLVRTQSAAQRDFLPGFQKIGVLLGFIVVILLVGTGLIFFFLPYLTLAAERGNDILASVSAPVVTLFFAILTWLFGTDFGANNAPVETTPTPGTSAPLSVPAWLEFIGKILAWGVGILVGLVLLAVIAGLLYGIFQWLFSKTPTDQARPSPRLLLSSIIAPWRAFILLIWRSLIRAIVGYTAAVQLYAALQTWGRISGVSHSVDETPAEYGQRLKQRFPTLEQEMESIIDAYHREVYGEIVLSKQQLAIARSAWGRLSSPAYWHLRLRSWFLRPSQISETNQQAYQNRI